MKLRPLILALSMLATPLALAHTDDYLDTLKTPNGGQMRMAGAYHFELVVAKDSKEAKENSVVVHVTDHADAKVATVGASGTATLLVGKEKVTVTLMPDGDNRLKGTGKYATSADMKAVVSVTMPGKAAESARFTPLVIKQSKPADPHAGHH
ncbi:MAG: hypothetical protein Q8M20_05760 [Rhodocyclaceae bacterium]|nr:hypothetical protein [Rhodocyclaceae bacterium]MDZ4214532.1 hypothetical protein [Rhodocyclaceae bacterium]